MLEHCTAVLVSRTDTQSAMLEKIAGKLGFAEIVPVSSRKAFASSGYDTRLTFFLVHHHLDNVVMSAVLRSIRGSESERVSFAPVIIFIEDCPFETYLHYVHIGFDDVLILPDKRDVLVHRVEQQIEAVQTYIKTGTYFGPDRRRMDLDGATDERRGKGEHWHEEITFQRDPRAGICILERRSVFGRNGQLQQARVRVISRA